MADLNIKKKKNTKPLLWAVLALIAVVAIIWVIAGDGEDESYVENEEIVAGSDTSGDDAVTSEENYNLDTEANDAVERFVTFTSDLGEIEIDHETSHRGITLLADALASVSESTQNEVDELRQQADQLLEDPMSEKHAQITHDAFVTAANIIEEHIANDDALTEEAAEVSKAAEAVDGDVLVTDQKDAIKNFFDQAANTLSSLE